MALILLLLALPLNALALSTDELNVLNYNAVYYHPNSGAKSSGGTGACISPLLPPIKDAAKFAAAIDDYIRSKQPDSPLIGAGNNFVQAGIANGINPAWVVNIARKESTFGVHVPPGSNNSYGLTATDSQPHVTANGRNWYKFDSFIDSPIHESEYLKANYIDQGLTDFTSITNKYAPPSENNTAAYIQEITSWVGEVIALAGDSVSCGGGGDVIAIAQQELALHLVGTGPEQNGGPVCKYQGSSCGEAWCADFVSWVFNQAGLPFAPADYDGWRIAAAIRVKQWYQTYGNWYPNVPSSPDPQPGDVVYFNHSHVAFVESYSSGKLTLISGNSGPSVTRYTVTRSSSVTGGADLAGWGRRK